MARPNVIPRDRAALDAIINNGQRVEEIARAGQLGELIRNYQLVVNADDPDIRRQIDEQAQQQLVAMLREGGAGSGRPDMSGPAARRHGAAHNRHAPGATLDGITADMGEYLRAIHPRVRTPEADAHLGRIRNAMGTMVPADGGFTVPEEFRSELLSVALEGAIVRPRARVMPMGSQRTLLPMIDDASHASTVFGGVTSYWTEEGATLTPSQPTFDRVALDAKKLTLYAEIPNELLADGPLAAAFVEQSFPQALRYAEDVAWLAGSGVGEPLGLLNADCAVTVAAEGSQPAGTILFANVVKMMARLLPGSWTNAVWIANVDTMPQLLQMTNPVKNVAGTENVGGQSVMLDFNAGAAASPTGVALLGRPIFFTEKVPGLGSVGDINLVDLSYYVIGDRQQLTAVSSEHYKFQNDVTAFRVIERVDGRPWLQSAITPRAGANTLSPFVKLAAR